MQEVTWTAVGLLAVTNMATWLKIIYDNKKSKNNPGKGSNKNNYYREIMDNKIRSKLNKQTVDAMCKVVNGMKEENKEDHKAIFEKLDRLFERMK